MLQGLPLWSWRALPYDVGRLGAMMRLKKMFRLLSEGLRRGLTGERVSIFMSGDEVARSLFDEWSAPHPHFRFIA